MKQAMNVLRQFSEKEKEYHRYQARQNFLREQSTIKHEMEELQQELAESKKKEAESEKREAKLIAQLLALA